MPDSSSRLDLLLFARRVVEQQTVAALRQIDSWIAEEERRETERMQGVRARPPAPDWLIQYGLNRANLDAVHVGGCWAAKKSGRCRPVLRTQALDALRQQVPACPHCRPDAELGIDPA
ncbi:hypothetical protein EASAB2608_01061 [Streptomyces sp. EAS-AB2608]|uniref:DUF6233 domain-containing protein n=1 Tax=Streptomyces sp. EAS-AB2608 TaxID=2779671 RepID=UPI001BEFA15A|nr:DUF6233 domain-containing protein [Streptomyces sp. EAS-AB2608]BCM65727.1 hypothetical protein EASAB2608_01061 [Streptomyces sp. EAS-AB2608]